MNAETAVQLAQPNDDATALDKAIAVGLWTVGLAWMIPMMSTMLAMNQVLSPRQTERFSRIYTRGQLLLTGSRWRAQVHPDVCQNTSYMFTQNHINLFDHVTLYNATPHFKQGLELEDHFKIPVYGWFMRSRGTIPVRSGRDGQTPEIMDRMRSEIANNGSILAFPEGTRTTDMRVGRYRKGVFFIARDLGIPIAPVAVTGMQRVNRKGTWIIRPGNTITVHICEPIETAGATDEQVGQIAAQVQAVTAAKVDAWLRELR